VRHQASAEEYDQCEWPDLGTQAAEEWRRERVQLFFSIFVAPFFYQAISVTAVSKFDRPRRKLIKGNVASQQRAKQDWIAGSGL
jgi:hypothetical protein